MRNGTLAFLVVCALGGGCAADGGEREIPPGRYGYTASHPAPGDTGPVRLEGVLEITESDPERISGLWHVPQLHPELQLGGWEDGAYEVMASPTYFGVLSHRIWRDAESGSLHCTGEYSWVENGGVEHSVPARCELTTEAPPLVQQSVPRADPTVRRIDADSVPLR